MRVRDGLRGSRGRIAGTAPAVPPPPCSRPQSAALPPMNSFAPLTQYPVLAAAVLLTVSNLFMTFAWYGHLKHLQASPWWTAALISWGIAALEALVEARRQQRPELRRGDSTASSTPTAAAPRTTSPASS